MDIEEMHKRLKYLNLKVFTNRREYCVEIARLPCR
jgi:hypothetical protein